ncbi:MAG: hypothetical protein QM777_09450 [Pseudorhodoferax sp.]
MSLLHLPSRVERRLRQDWHRWRFAAVARGARSLPPLERGHLPYVMLSMVHTRDVDAYLVAAQSFARQVPPERVVIVCDPSITDADRAVLRAAIPHVELVRAEDFRHPELPVGGCWERLQAMTHYAQSAYVVQLDADTVSSGPLPEVVEAIRSGSAFILGERPDQCRVSLAEASAAAAGRQRPNTHVHVQGVAEYMMGQAQLSGAWYVRGCAGFFGLPQSGHFLDDALAYSREMRRLVGERWNEWGTEQVTSNYLAANCEGFAVLPWPKYATPSQRAPNPVFSHFIGMIRFASDAYRHAASQAIAAVALNQKQDPA